MMSVEDADAPRGSWWGGGYLGELGHQCAVLQPEVLLLAVQLPLQHLRLAQQRLHFLQRQPTRQLAFNAATANKNAPAGGAHEQSDKNQRRRGGGDPPELSCSYSEPEERRKKQLYIQSAA